MNRKNDFVAFALVLTGLLVASLPTAAAGTAKDDPLDENYLTGYLVWKDEKGTITWEQDPSLPKEATRAAPTPGSFAPELGWSSWFSTGSDGGRIPVDVFESDPTPVRILINASRMIKIDLFIPGEASGMCRLAAAELYANDVLVGGSQAPDNLITGYKPGACHVRIRSEVATIEAGSKLKLRVIYISSDEPFRYGMNGATTSVVRLPFLPPDDAILRVKGADNQDAQGAAAMGGLALLSVVAGQRSREKRLAVALLMVLLIAGCAGKPATVDPNTTPSPTGGTAQVRFLNDTLPVNQSVANVFGVVRANAMTPVANAFVYLLPGPNSTQTDEGGRFYLNNVQAKEATLRVEAGGFLPFEVKILPEPGRTSWVDVTLVNKEDPGRQPHLHLFWDRPIKTLFDGNVMFPLQDRCQPPSVQPPGFAGTTQRSNDACMVPFRLPSDPASPILIYPGTRELRVKLEYDFAKLPFRSMGIGFSSNDDPAFRYASFVRLNTSFMLPKPSGATTTIQTSWEMMDSGHATWSGWRFYLFAGFRHDVPAPPGAPPPIAAYSARPAPVRVVIEAVEGPLPLEPAHPDPWGGLNRLVVLPQLTVSTDATCWPSTPKLPLCVWPSAGATWTPTYPIPADTRRLEAWLNLSKAPGAGTTNQFVLRFKTAVDPPPSAVNDYSSFTTWAPEGSAQASRTYSRVLKLGEADAIYAKVSNWIFMMDDGSDTYTTNPESISMSFTVHAVR